MARREKREVDYFPFFAKRGKTLNILQRKYGLEGIGFFTNLMRFLALTPGHFYCIKEDEDKLNLFAEIGIEDEKGIAMIELMVTTKKLDKTLWENFRVIASKDFFESLQEAYRKRSSKLWTIEELITSFENGDKGISAEVSGGNTDSNGVTAETSSGNITGDNVSGGINPQIKENKRKEKKRKISDGSKEPQKKVRLLDREPTNDKERVEKKWLENYIKLFNSEPINPAWSKSAPLIKKAIMQTGVEKILQALDSAMQDEFCLKAGYILKTIMSSNVLSRLVNAKKSSSTHRISADQVPKDKTQNFFREANV